MTPKLGFSLFFVAIAFFAIWPSVNPACAGGIANQTCDAAVWETMSSRARLETEREIMQNQNLIFKADSILSYMCFDAMAGHVANNVGPIFTHNDRWDEFIPLEEGQEAMDNAVRNAMEDYIDDNFHGNDISNYLGGRAEDLFHPVPVSSTEATAYACEEMAKVWQVAKCMNFTLDNETDGFYPLIDIDGVAGYSSINEVRNHPLPCAGEPLPGTTWEDLYRFSRNEIEFGTGDPLYDFHEPLNTLFEDVRDLVEPGECDAAVLTGVTVVPSNGETYSDGVCTNPGCTFQRSGTCTATPAAPANGGGGEVNVGG